MKKRIISLALAAFMACSFLASCKGKGDSGQNGGETNLIEVEAMLPETIAETGKYIVENGSSEYTIVIPLEAEQILQSAASELQGFIEKASGARLPIENDANYTFNQETKVISLGDTSIWQGSGLELSADLRQTGYIMKRMGDAVVCNALDGVGTTAAVYDMLNYLVGFECYAADEIYYEEKTTLPLLDFNIKFIPTVDVRDIMSQALSSSILYNQRMRLYTEYGKGMWITFAHTTITDLLPTSTYQVAHPNWYNASGTQVCYANDEMRAEMVKQIKNRIANNEDGIYVMIGHEDNHDMCECQDCIEAREILGGYGGQELDFTNKVAAEVAPWVEENYPGRNVKYVFFAYQTSAKPPVKWDETQGKYVPLYDNFSLHKDTMVLVCPIEMDFSEKMDSDANKAHYEQLKGWYEIFAAEGLSDNICIWTYSITSKCYVAPTNNYAYFGEHYKVMSDVGVSFIMDQFVHDSRVTCFEELRIYTMAKLMYRYDLSYNDLVNDFMTHYYGEASKEMKTYYEFYRAYLQYLQEEKAFGGALTVEAQSKDFWPLEVLQHLVVMLDGALEAIEPLQQTNPVRYQTLKDRILKEKVVPTYLLFSYYMSALSQAQKEQYWTEINDSQKKFALNNSAEGRINMAESIEDWRLQIFG